MNECEETNGGCEALCCNTIGSFYCRCPPGQKLNEDGKTCQGLLFVLVSFRLKEHSTNVTQFITLVVSSLFWRDILKVYLSFLGYLHATNWRFKDLAINQSKKATGFIVESWEIKSIKSQDILACIVLTFTFLWDSSWFLT